jgi:choline dehydrogenase-like flavoprotein
LGIHDGRERAVGGTTTIWGGQAYPFLPEDFSSRPNLGISGWPLTYEDLVPYYKRAEMVVGTDHDLPYDYKPWAERDIDTADLAKDKLRLLVTKWSNTPNFFLLHGNTLSQSENVTVLYHASAVEIVPSPGLDSVQEVAICSLSGKRGTVKARQFIAAGGSLEATRLFLASRRFHPAGLGNENDLVGRYIQDHISAVVGEIIPTSRKHFHEVFDPFYRNGFKYLPRILVEPAHARDQNTLHASGQIVFSESSESVLNTLKSILRKVKKGELPKFGEIKTLLNPSQWVLMAKSLYRWRVEKRGISAEDTPIWLEILSEQLPQPESRVTLSDQDDFMGMPRLKLDWKIPELTRDTIVRSAQTFQEEFARSGLGELKLEAWLDDPTDNSSLKDVFHQAGGLIMGESNWEGVVDPNCKVFGVDNLYVASSAVFPTSSFANTTLTIMALSVRLSDRIASTLTDGGIDLDEQKVSPSEVGKLAQ